MGPVNGAGAPQCLAGIVDTKLMGLVDFMFSPHKFLANTTGDVDTPYIIFASEKMFLANNKTDVTLWDIARANGIQNPIGIAVATDQVFEIVRDEKHVLDNLRMAGSLGGFNIVQITDATDSRF